MGAVLGAGLSNAAWTLVLALAAAAGARWWRDRPAVGHALWLLVLLKLVTPSVLQFSLPRTDPQTTPEARVPIAPPEPGAPVVTERPPVDPAPAVSERVVPFEGRPPEVLDPRPSAWEFTGERAVSGLALVWLAGAVAWWSAVGLNSARFRRLLRSARPAPAELREQVGRVAERLGLREVPAACLLLVRMSPMVWVPLAGPPRLVLPEELWGRLDASQRDAVLAHELAHLKRRDHWVRRLEALACGLYWWDPVAWWARREVGRAEEQCCDAWVLWALPTAAAAYAEALVVTATYLSGLRRPLPAGASGVGHLRFLKGRLQMILSDPTTASVKRTAPWALLALGALCLPFLPAPTRGGAPAAAAAQTPAETPRKPDTPATPADPKGDPAAPPDALRVVQPVVREVADSAEFVGQIAAAREVELRARVSGTLTEVACRPGQAVSSGDLLFKIDRRPYLAAYSQADAEFDRASAQRALKQNELANAKKLEDQRAVSQNEVQSFEVRLREAGAAVKVAQAARDAAFLNLEFTGVKAPFNGRISGPVLGQGSVAVADTTRLATIVSTDQFWVNFNVAESLSLRFRRQGAEPYEGKGEVVVALGDGTDYPHRGKVDSSEVGIDPTTGTARWRASLPNPDGLLLPGMSVRVRMATGAPHKATLVPAPAVLEQGGQASVFVVTGEDVVRKRPVKIAGDHGDMMAVADLRPDEWVVIDGVRDLREGAKVRITRVPPAAPVSGGRP